MQDDYSFMDVNLDEAKDMVILPDGTPAELEVRSVKIVPEKSYIAINFKPLNQGEFVSSFTERVFFPKEDDEAEKRNNKLLQIKKVVAAFDLGSPREISEEYLLGKTVWAVLGIEHDASGAYPDKNRVKQYMAPQG